MKVTFFIIRTAVLSFFILGIFSNLGCEERTQQEPSKTQEAFFKVGRDDEKIQEAYQGRSSGLWVESVGQVERLLDDDLKVPRHQRFIIRLKTGQTLLVTHNIDMAPRLEDLDVGGWISFRGLYEWNDKGGVVHYTHRDPSGRMSGGWIEYQGKRYQ